MQQRLTEKYPFPVSSGIDIEVSWWRLDTKTCRSRCPLPFPPPPSITSWQFFNLDGQCYMQGWTKVCFSRKLPAILILSCTKDPNFLQIAKISIQIQEFSSCPTFSSNVDLQRQLVLFKGWNYATLFQQTLFTNLPLIYHFVI